MRDDEIQQGNVRVQGYVPDVVEGMFRELARAWFPNRTRVDGLVLERLIREASEKLRKEQGKPTDR